MNTDINGNCIKLTPEQEMRGRIAYRELERQQLKDEIKAEIKAEL